MNWKSVLNNPKKKRASLEIKKHSSLVQMWNVSTLWERRAMNALIRIAKDQLKRDEDRVRFHCKLGLVKRLSGIKDGSNLILKRALVSLNKTNFEYNVLNKDKKKRGVFCFLAEALIEEQGRGQETIVTFEFPTTVLNVIKNPNIYVKLNMYILMGLESKHSMSLYEHIKDYEKIKSLRCQIDLFRKIMGLKDGQYEIFTMLKKRVLDTAVAEINKKTDKALTYELEREGRKIVAIVFRFSDHAIQWSEESTENDFIQTKLKSFGLKQKKIDALIDHHDPQYLMANIATVEKQAKKGGIKNITAYILKAFENDYRPEHQKSGLTAIHDEQQKKRVEEEENKKRIQEQEQAFAQWKAELIANRMKTFSDEQKETMKSVFLESIENNPFFAKFLASGWFDQPVIQIQWQKHLEGELLSDEERSKDKFEHYW